MISVRPLVRAPQLSIVADARRKPTRRLFSSASTPILPPLVSPDVSNTASYEKVDALLKQKIVDLEYSLSIRGNPSRIWSQYTSLVNNFGRESLPLKMYQQVLRQCTPPTSKLRFSSARRLLAMNVPRIPHIHEGRFQTVIRAIRSMGMKPDLEDYHFILEQFAAAGHYSGSLHVYKEILHLGLQPNSTTFALCFQAIAHRLTLPILVLHHHRLIAQTKRMTSELLNDMKKFRVSFTPVSLDLCTRILKETLDNDGFDSLMKWGYGIDLSNPDRPALEYSRLEDRKVDVGIPDIELPALHAMVPFSTMALNTTIEVLGRLGNVSKLVQAFETLTTPLPQASQHLFSSFDDDDGDFGVKVPVSQTYNQYAEPNTTTFALLIRHLCSAGHTILARHYLIQLMKLEKERRHIFRHSLKTSPLNKIAAPRISVTRATLLPVYGESNRGKHVELMRWLNTKLPRIIKGKRTELAFCKHIHEKLTRARALLYQQEYMYSDVSSPSTQGLTPSSSTASDLLRAVRPRDSSSRMRRNFVKVGTPIYADLDQELASHPSSEIRPFNLNLHIEHLERELERIEHLASTVDDVLGRTVQRVKERLGRRVWGGKDLYLSGEDKRLNVSRAQWIEIVNFKPRRGYPGDGHSLQRAATYRTRIGNPLMRIYRRPRMKSAERPTSSYSG
ncbi:hypothetical protein F5887DRAFT_194620 [Amanita rubescens]|nr:hypothetical protein F5887DRAFT_194620 [Amanita rubescens]